MSNPQLLPGNRTLHFSLFVGLFLSLAVFLIFGWSPATRAKRVGSKAPASDAKRSRYEFVPGDVLVRYRSDAVAKHRQLAATISTAEGRDLPIRVERFGGSDVVDGLRLAHVAPDETLNAIAALKAQPDVLYAEPNYIVHPTLTPNDPSFGNLYGLTKIGAPTAWNSTTGSAGIVVGDIDEGIDINHPDLVANIWNNPVTGGGSIPGITGDVNGYDFFHNNGTIPPGDHATHTAGTIGATGNNGVGVVGVNWTVKLMSLKFINNNSGSDADAIRACSYAKQMRDLWVSSGGTQGANVRVLNNSYGGGGFTQAFLDVINGLNSSGILFVAAAGNFPEDPNIDNDLTPFYPAGYAAPNVIAVAATDSSDGLASFSHYGAQTVDLGAPGVGIQSTVVGNQYSFFSGTSMATPHVTGAAALLWAQNPNLTVSKVKSLLLFNGDPVASLNGKTLTGRRLNVGNSFATLALNDTIPPGTATNFRITSQSARTINLAWTSSGDNGATGQAALYQVNFTDAATGAVVPLQSHAPPTSGTAEALTIKIPFGHNVGTITLQEFDKAGNEGTAATVPVSIPFVDGNPYASAVGKSVGLSTGGTGMGLKADDGLKTQALPFAFPFFGQNFNSVIVSTNGNLYFSPPPTRSNGDADDVPSATFALTQFKMISGLWDDLRTDLRADGDVFIVTPDPNRIIFRWQGNIYGDGTNAMVQFPVNFEIELRSNGLIQSRYGAGNTNVFPVVGISGGEPDAYLIPQLTSEFVLTNLTNAQEATYIPRGVINPDDNIDFFVSQHYRDFLSREPDPGGEAFWIDQLAGNANNTPPPCANGDVNCLNTRRISVSNSFFYSLEFQQAGAYVFRLYREAFGNSQPFPVIDNVNQPEANKLPDYAHFNPDSQLVVGGANLSQEQQDLANAFALRPEFITKYPAGTLDQFVTAILANIQNDSGADLTGLHNSLVALGSRGAVLYRLANDDLQGGNGGFNNRALIDAEYNRAFVYTQYSGYFRRNPDIGGFLFWFGQVNSGPLRDTAKQLALVCSQITSGEYQFRFSTILSHNNQECPQ